MSEIDLDKKVTFESETGQFGGDPDSDIGDRQFHHGFWCFSLDNFLTDNLFSFLRSGYCKGLHDAHFETYLVIKFDIDSF